MMQEILKIAASVLVPEPTLRDATFLDVRTTLFAAAR